jgi:hypothetical protein
MFTFNTVKTEKQYSALSMAQYGISAVILTEHENFEKQITNFEIKPDAVWCNGRGKKYLHNLLKKNLKSEDCFFSKNTHLMTTKNQRWTDFCDDCVIFATLSSYLFDTPIHFIHPSVYEEFLGGSINIAPPQRPSVIDGIANLH